MKWFRRPGWAFCCALWAMVVIVGGAVLCVVFWDQLTAGGSLISVVRNIGLVEAALIAIPLAFWRSITADRQSNTAFDLARTGLRQADTASQSLLNERYQKGAEMLGGSVLTVRLGGIYALQRLAEERPDDYHIQIMNLFCAFVRQQTGPDDAWGSPVTMDVQEAMNVIGHRSHAGRQIERDAEYVLDLSGVSFFEARLEKANLSGAMLGGTRLGGGSLAGVDLTDAYLSGVSLIDVDLRGAILDGANLSRATLIRTDMTGASLTKTVLDGAHFSDVKALDQRALLLATPIIDNPPTFMDCVDSKTGEELVWPPLSAPRSRGE